MQMMVGFGFVKPFVATTKEDAIASASIETVSYTHLDVYKRQALICADKGDNVAVREIRKHIGWYVKGMRGASYVKRTANQIKQASELIELLRGLLK